MMNDNEEKLTPLERILLSTARNNSERLAIIANAIQRQVSPVIDQLFDSQFLTMATRKEDIDKINMLVGEKHND